MSANSISKSIIYREPVTVDKSLSNLPLLLQRIFATRGIQKLEELDLHLSQLSPPTTLFGIESIVELLIESIETAAKIIIVADYDADGATACAIAMRGLTLLGAKNLDFMVPNRFEHDYGLTPELVLLIKKTFPAVAVIITVDNGISSVEGVEMANQLGIKVGITDHHAPPSQLPAATAIVNPKLINNTHKLSHLAGCGVMFYVLWAIRHSLINIGRFSADSAPNLAVLLDYVALGTIADVVVLDQTNRILVQQGLARIRAGQAHYGIQALIQLAAREMRQLTSSDLGFSIAPRLNAAGRMSDMSLGIRCLLADDITTALALAQQLEQFNQQRKTCEAQMKQQAIRLIDHIERIDTHPLLSGICLYDKEWHSGIIGILAARLKERCQRPVIAFAAAKGEEIRGSARSIQGIHIRDVLSEIATAYPKLLKQFGGHAMAGGLTLKLSDLPSFTLIFNQIIHDKLMTLDPVQTIVCDGQLSSTELIIDTAHLIKYASVWGHGFPEPLFHNTFSVIQCRILAQQHVKWVLKLTNTSVLIDAIAFFVDQPNNWLTVSTIEAIYRLDINYYRGQNQLQLQLIHFFAVTH
ncbi:MAG: Single-stranded-DNA-specific exonuclease RecJ [Pseudomonadota bacterium]|jgi:single-stranded-DNA-specific exonuclease